MAYIPDDMFYFLQSDTINMMHYYKGMYPNFDEKQFYRMQEFFPSIDVKRNIRKLSKGMQKQVAFWLALCCKPKLIVLDEPVDGLDPVMRRQIWSIMLDDVAANNTTVVVSSHNLRELEDVCDPIEQYDRKKSEYELMGQVAALGVPMCRPLEFGTFDEGVYSIQTWIDGIDAEENIHNLTDQEQYSYGFEAGKILKEIHKIPAPKEIEDWEIYFNRKADHKIKMYEECPVKYENGQAFIDYINAHRYLLSGRPRTYQHGDYHIGNMMIGNDKRLYIIDFNRNDFGDPWEEFNRIVWCAQATPLFATGMVNGYFSNDVPIPFWELLALYISSNALSSVPWAIPFGQSQIQVMINQAKDVLSWYENMTKSIPTWYKGVIINK